MIKLCGYWLVPEKMFPHLRKAHRLARELSEQRIDDILEHRYHLHKNAGKRKPKEEGNDKPGTIQPAQRIPVDPDEG